MQRLLTPILLLAGLTAPALCATGGASGWFVTDDRGQSGGLYQISQGVTDGMAGDHALLLTGGAPRHYANLLQTLPARDWRGQRVRVRLRVKKPDDAKLLIAPFSVRGDGAKIQTQSQQNEAGNTGWQAHQFVMDVPDSSSQIGILLHLIGKGSVWVDSVSLEKVASDVPVTRNWAIQAEPGGASAYPPVYGNSFGGQVMAPSSCCGATSNMGTVHQ